MRKLTLGVAALAGLCFVAPATAQDITVGFVTSLSGPASLATSGTSATAARAWTESALPGDFGVTAAVYLDSLVPVQLFARGTDLEGGTPSYYAASVVRGLEVQLLRVVDGGAVSLGKVKSKSYFSGKWAQVTLCPEGDVLRVQVFRPDTGQRERVFTRE